MLAATGEKIARIVASRCNHQPHPSSRCWRDRPYHPFTNRVPCAPSESIPGSPVTNTSLIMVFGRITNSAICGTHIAVLVIQALLQGKRGEGRQNRDSGRCRFRLICADVRPCDADGDANHLERRRPRQQQSHLGAEGFSGRRDRKSTRLNSSHSQISYAVFCLKKKTQAHLVTTRTHA